MGGFWITNADGKKIWIDRTNQKPLTGLDLANLMNKKESELKKAQYGIKNLKGIYHDSRIGVFKKDETTRRLRPCLVCGQDTSSNRSVCQRCQVKKVNA